MTDGRIVTMIMDNSNSVLPTISDSYHKFIVCCSTFEIPSYYSLDRAIGNGVSGIVISALDKRNNEKVAIKKIKDAFKDPHDAKRILREIQMIKKFSHENVRS